MSRGARTIARLLAGAPATSVNLDDLDVDWRPLPCSSLRARTAEG